MSGFSDDFHVGSGDLLEDFGEVVTVNGPGVDAAPAVAVVMEKPSAPGSGGGQSFRERHKTFEFRRDAFGDTMPAVGWSVTHEGVAYTVLSAHVSGGGMVCCEAINREAGALGGMNRFGRPGGG